MFKQILLAVLLLITPALNAGAQTRPAYNPKARFHPVVAKNSMITSEESYATRAGLQVLREGGNAVDAAVTVGFTLAVTYPRAGNIGGGGFMLIYIADTNEVVAIDYREKAPGAATRDMFVDQEGNVDKEKSMHSVLSAGVPGTVAGLALALDNYGTITLKRALQPAIELAESGFIVNRELSDSLLQAKERMNASSASMEIFFKTDGATYMPGDTIVQKDLAKSLKDIAKNGASTFYSGEIARKIDIFMKESGGLITKEDMASYKPVIRKPVSGTYRGYEIYSMPPPSSGGVHLIQILNLLEHYPLNSYGHNTAKSIHIMAEAMKLAYAERSKHLGDPDFSPVPVKELISKSYSGNNKHRIDSEKPTPSKEILPSTFAPSEGNNTTHFSVIDSYGNAVSNTYTLNFSYGSKITVPGTGILLNNEMDDFSSKPGTPNAYGLVGGKLNAIGPNKRMLSSMTPTIVMKEGKPFIVTGSPGGSRIITTVLQIITNVIDFNMNIAQATNAPRIHHQWLPDELRGEEGISDDTINLLEHMGHKVIIGPTMGSTQSIMKLGDYLYGASDPRRSGGLSAGD